VPLLAALVGLLLSLGAVKYTAKLSYAPDQARPARQSRALGDLAVAGDAAGRNCADHAQDRGMLARRRRVH
jgi:hypothetical protein